MPIAQNKFEQQPFCASRLHTPLFRYMLESLSLFMSNYARFHHKNFQAKSFGDPDFCCHSVPHILSRIQKLQRTIQNRFEQYSKENDVSQSM